ncbi:MAG TPA: rod shape-determining protein RodA [Candidatus Paceibacterota bacterium]
MTASTRKIFPNVDWLLLLSVIPLLVAGFITMNSFVKESYFAPRQLIWISISIAVFLVFSFIDWRILRNTWVLLIIYAVSIILLLVIFAGSQIRGVESWLNFGLFSFQPADIAKLVLILVLAKYFSRRHVEIAHFKHIFISGLYAFVPFALILIQPDFGSALIILVVWLGMILVSGVSKKHLVIVLGAGLVAFAVLWMFVFAPYQKARIMSFLDPLRDPQGTGYNALQSTIAVGSGQIMGKGVGYGTQSRLEFLPEYQTDFIFAAFAEEWGLIGVLIMFGLFGIIIWRILASAIVGASNFEIYFGVGLSIMLMAHFVIHVGMNIGVLPVTGLPLPFVSYGGSHLLTEFIGLGILSGMRKYSRGIHKEDIQQEFLGI